MVTRRTFWCTAGLASPLFLDIQHLPHPESCLEDSDHWVSFIKAREEGSNVLGQQVSHDILKITVLGNFSSYVKGLFWLTQTLLDECSVFQIPPSPPTSSMYSSPRRLPRSEGSCDLMVAIQGDSVCIHYYCHLSSPAPGPAAGLTWPALLIGTLTIWPMKGVHTVDAT